MEAKNVKVISLMVIVMLGMLAEKSSAFSEMCYVGCLVQCVLLIVMVTRLCFNAHCDVTITHDSYCKFGCAASSCIKKSTPKDPRGDEVERCVNSFCRNKCTN
ncbi:hypothetical protein MKX01_027029 [Papaver californicum]|nr:hypothetical protein MKX01_027029 [Papaver californicum]